MQQVQTASRWTELLKWAGSLGTLLVGIGAFIGSFVNRKRRDIQRADKNKTEAETANIYGHLAFETIEKVREIQKLNGFLEQQLRYRCQLEVIARNRTHRAIGELSSANLVIREREEMLRNADVKFEPYKVKTQEDIFGDEDLPLPPDVDLTLS